MRLAHTQSALLLGVHVVVEGDDLVRDFQHAKDQYVQLSKEELDSLAEANNNIDLKEFIPLTSVDPVYLRTPINSAQDRKKDCHKPETNRLDDSGFTARESVDHRRYW